MPRGWRALCFCLHHGRRHVPHASAHSTVILILYFFYSRIFLLFDTQLCFKKYSFYWCGRFAQLVERNCFTHDLWINAKSAHLYVRIKWYVPSISHDYDNFENEFNTFSNLAGENCIDLHILGIFNNANFELPAIFCCCCKTRWTNSIRSIQHSIRLTQVKFFDHQNNNCEWCVSPLWLRLFSVSRPQKVCISFQFTVNFLIVDRLESSKNHVFTSFQRHWLWSDLQFHMTSVTFDDSMLFLSIIWICRKKKSESRQRNWFFVANNLTSFVCTSFVSIWKEKKTIEWLSLWPNISVSVKRDTIISKYSNIFSRIFSIFRYLDIISKRRYQHQISDRSIEFEKNSIKFWRFVGKASLLQLRSEFDSEFVVLKE